MAKHDIEEQRYDLAGARVAIVAARFNAAVVDALLAGAETTLARHAISTQVWRVPGAFELPFTARRLAISGHFEAVITLGAVIRGGTPHFDYVCAESARGVMQAGLEADLPVIFGVLTCDDRAQADARAGGDDGNKGHEAALAALEMIACARSLAAGVHA